MRIRFNIKALTVYLLILTAGIVLASFYGGLLPFVFLYGMLLLLPLSLVYVILNYHFLSVYQELPDHRVVKGDPHEFLISFENRGFLPIHDMDLILHSDRCDLEGIRDGEKISIAAFSLVKMSSKLACRYGGAYEVGLRELGFSDVFGIMNVIVKVPYTFRAIVSPKITDMADRYLDIENTINSMGSKSDIRTEDIPGNEMREYSPGDPIKTINWKVSARLDKLMVRIPDKMDTRTVTLILEPSASAGDLTETAALERRDCFLEFAVSAAWYFVRRDMPLKVIYPAGKISEKIIGSYESFLDFYKDISGGMSYRSDDEKERMHALAQERRRRGYGNETRVIVLEDEWPGEDFCIVAD